MNLLLGIVWVTLVEFSICLNFFLSHEIVHQINKAIVNLNELLLSDAYQKSGYFTQICILSLTGIWEIELSLRPIVQKLALFNC
jgi:hypothetical protein